MLDDEVRVFHSEMSGLMGKLDLNSTSAEESNSLTKLRRKLTKLREEEITDDEKSSVSFDDKKNTIRLGGLKPQEAAKVLLSGKLTDDVIHAALAGHYGKRAAKASTIYGADMTANGVNYSFKAGFKRMFRAALRALANGGDSNG